ncbi:MAG: YSC84-related protein [Geminicoccaceae bacterium]
MTTSTRRSLLTTSSSLLALAALAACSNSGSTGGTSSTPAATSTSAGSRRDILVQQSRVALEDLYRQVPPAKDLAARSKAVLVFPSVVQAGFGIGGAFGDGVLFEGGKPTAFYNLVQGSFGFQIGGQALSQAYFFTTQEALNTFKTVRGFSAAGSATAVAATYGADGRISTETLQRPVVVFTWGQSGLMAGATVQGQKITQINP